MIYLQWYFHLFDQLFFIYLDIIASDNNSVYLSSYPRYYNNLYITSVGKFLITSNSLYRLFFNAKDS